jgi:TetR/AcrR family transcriptional regulator, tetracycline repressor protein
MSLSRTLIVDAAGLALRDRGLAGLSMRRLAQDLGVQPGALYHHVASKQDLLAAVGEHIVAASAPPPGADPVAAAAALRTALLAVRDGAEVISFVYAFRPAALAPYREMVGDTVICFVLGFVGVEQNRAELARAGILTTGAEGTDTDASFAAGVRALLV